MQKVKEILELATAVIRWGALVIGGVCLLVVCMTTGWFPEDMTIGEGAALYFIFVGFLLAYAVYWLGVTSTGLLVMRWPMELLNRLDKKVPAHAVAYAFSSFKSMWSLPVWVVAGIAVVFAAISIRFDLSDIARFGGIIVLQGFFGGLLLAVRRRLQLDASGLSLSDRMPNERLSKNMGEIRHAMYAVFAAWIVMPMVLGQNYNAVMGAAFRLSQLRKDNATIHVASPWSERLTAAGMKPHESFLGANYARFEDVTVRMRSIGSRVVLQVPSSRKKPLFINIPRQSIEVE